MENFEGMANFRALSIDTLHYSPTNPRRFQDDKKFQELCASVKEKGIVQPILVRPLPLDGKRAKKLGDPQNHFEIVFGERRVKAARKATLETVPAQIRALSDKEALEIQIIENNQREDIHPLDEGDGYKRLIAMDGYTVEMIADKVSKSVSHIYDRMKLAELSKPVKEAFLGDAITTEHAKLLSRLQGPDQIEGLKAATGQLESWRADPMTVRQFKVWIQENVVRDLDRAPWKLDDAELVKAAGACDVCPKRAGSNPDLFGDIAKGNRCTDSKCFAVKHEAHMAKVKTEVKEKGEKLVELSDQYRTVGKLVGSQQWQKAGAVVCDDTHTGVITEQGFRNSDTPKGTVLKVCLKPGRCKIHNPRDTSGASERGRHAAAERAVKVVASNIRSTIFDAILATRMKGDKKELRMLARLFYDHLGFESGKAVNQRHGWKDEYAPAKEVALRIKSIADKDLPRFLLELAIVPFVGEQYLGRGEDPLLWVADTLGVKHKKIAADLQAAFDAKNKEKQAKARKKTQKTKAAASKGRPAGATTRRAETARA